MHSVRTLIRQGRCLGLRHHWLQIKIVGCQIKRSSFTKICLGSIGMDCVKSKLYYKVTILPRHYRKKDHFYCHFSIHVIPLGNFMVKVFGFTTGQYFTQICVITWCVI